MVLGFVYLRRTLLPLPYGNFETDTASDVAFLVQPPLQKKARGALPFWQT